MKKKDKPGRIKLTFFNSFEAENEAVYRNYACMTPYERLALVNSRRMRNCPGLQKPDTTIFGKRLLFKKNQE